MVANGYQHQLQVRQKTKVIYFTGDTVLYPDLTKNVPKNIDAETTLRRCKIRFICGPFTMT